MPSLSHSACDTWQQCPKRWQLTKVQRVPQAPADALILGDAFHQALEADALGILAGGSVMKLDALLVVFGDSLAMRLAKDDPKNLLSADVLLGMEMRGYAMLRAYVEAIQPHYAPESTEEAFRVDIPGADGWTFSGRIDARMVGDDGVAAVLDWKTGKAWRAMDAEQKPQATAYLWAERESGRIDAARVVRFVVFPTVADNLGGYTCTPQILDTSRTPRELDSYPLMLRRTIASIDSARRSGIYEARTGPLCGWCSCLGACKLGQDWLASKGRKPAVPVLQTLEGGAE